MSFTVDVAQEFLKDFSIDELTMTHVECRGGRIKVILLENDKDLELKCERCENKESILYDDERVNLALLGTEGGRFCIKDRGVIRTFTIIKK